MNPWQKGNGIVDPMDYKFQLGKDKIFQWQRGRNRSSFLAWYEIYKNRFPNHYNLEKLYKLADQAYKKDYLRNIRLPYKPHLMSSSPLYNDYSGMSPSCLYYRLND